MAEKSERTKKLEEAKIEDDPLYVKRALRGLGVGMSRMADKAGFTQDEKKEEPVKKAKGGYVKAADGCVKKGKTKGRMV